LNKQYSKDEYERLVPRIVRHMSDMPYRDSLGRTYAYGEFFPPELSPFAYNHTQAQKFFPLSRDEAVASGFRWSDADTRQYHATIAANDLPDTIVSVGDDIIDEVIGCTHQGTCGHDCATAFKVVPEELGFYRRMNIPLPRLCFNCRHGLRSARRNPLKLWHRTCTCAGTTSTNGVYKNTAAHSHGAGKCSNGFETPYAPDRPEIVYCEQCYNAEVA
jgi:hypothetical protein